MCDGRSIADEGGRTKSSFHSAWTQRTSFRNKSALFFLTGMELYILSPPMSKAATIARCSSLVLTDTIQTTWPMHLGREGFIWLTYLNHSPLQREAGQELLTRTASETMEKHLLACSLRLVQVAFFVQLRTNFLGMTWPTTSLGPYISIINQENVPQTCLQANLVEPFSQLSFHLPRWL